MPKSTQSVTDIIGAFILKNPNAYLAPMILDPSKAFVRNGKPGTAPYYGSAKSSKSTVSLGGLELIDTARVWIPNAPKAMGTPSPGWWLDMETDVTNLPTTIFRVVIAE